jgi:hypothetical protein
MWLATIRTTDGIGCSVEDINTTFRKWLKKAVPSEEMQKRLLELARKEGQITSCPDLTEDAKRLFQPANEIPLHWHIQMQAAFQRHTNCAVSKTINLPHSATKEDVARAYSLAIQAGLKGITVFRDGCLEKTGQVQPMARRAPEPVRTISPKPCQISPIRPQIGLSMRSIFGMVHLHITVDPTTDRELEVFGCVGKAGELKLAQMEGIGRLVSMLLRLGGTMAQVVSQLKGIGSSHTTLSNGGRHLSLEDTVGHMLAKYLEAKQRWGMKRLLLHDIPRDELAAFWSAALETKQEELAAIFSDEETAQQRVQESNPHGLVCQSCGAQVVVIGGCFLCPSCGESRC